jgi:hypothetical protein
MKRARRPVLYDRFRKLLLFSPTLRHVARLQQLLGRSEDDQAPDANFKRGGEGSSGENSIPTSLRIQASMRSW